MTRQQEHAHQRLKMARAAYEREPDSIMRQVDLARAEARYTAAMSHTRPSYLKGERL